MRLSDFDYELPQELIAQEPLKDRDASRLMVLKVKGTDCSIEHRIFSDLLSYVEPGDILVLNETKVEPSKLIGQKSTGGKVQLILAEKLDSRTYRCQLIMSRPRIGAGLIFADGLKGTLKEFGKGTSVVEFNRDDVEELVRSRGEMPLPPYIKRPAEKDQYQTVYAKNPGSIAAPTAGFHFTPELLRDIESKGVKIARITLHVGFGTFLPVKSDDITDHKMHEEWYEISAETADMINSRRGRLIVVGTTSLRAIESAAVHDGFVISKKAGTKIFIYPGYKFRIRPDMMVTNFHLPKSTLLMLVSALAGLNNIKKAYKEAVEKQYRFFSFGDAMLISLTR